jgi:hypothetical protein
MFPIFAAFFLESIINLTQKNIPDYSSYLSLAELNIGIHTSITVTHTGPPLNRATSCREQGSLVTQPALRNPHAW